MKEQILLILSAFFILGNSYAAMAIRNDSGHHGYYTIQEDGKPVLTYNFGTVTPPKGVKGNFLNPRSDYVHPVFGPSGEILTAVFDNWHNHHRGIYWAWAEVGYKGRIHDLHALKGVFARPVKILKKEASADKALISAENVWRWEEREDIVRERIDITAYAQRGGLRSIDFDLTLTPLKEGVTLARRQRKNYASFNLRMSKRRGMSVVRHTDPATAFPRRSWGEVTGIPEDGKEPIGMMILQSPKNPFYPGVWTYFQHLPWLEPGFPVNGTAYPLKIGESLRLSYRVIVRSGEGLKVAPEKLFDEYVKDIPMRDPLAGMAGYQLGQSRQLLTSIEREIRNTGKPGYAAMEARLLKILSTWKCSMFFEKWAFGQLQMIASPASMPVAYKALCERDSWLTALDVLIALPGEASGKLLLQGLKTLPADRKAAVIHAIGLRGDLFAIPVLKKFAAEGDKDTARSARFALRKILKGADYDSWGIEKVCGQLSDEAIDRALQKAGEFGRSERAVKIFRAVWTCGKSRSWQKAAALIGLSKCSSDSAGLIVASLSSPDKFIRKGAAKAMESLNRSALKGLCSGFSAQIDPVKIMILNAWSKKGVAEAEPQVLAALGSGNPIVKLAAMRALAGTGHSTKAVEALMKVALSTSCSTSLEARGILGRMNGEAVVRTLRAMSLASEGKQANIATKVLADRRDPGYLDSMVAVVKVGIPLPSRTALMTLRRLATAKQALVLRAIMSKAPSALLDSLAETLVGIAKRGVPGADLKTILKSGAPLTREGRAALVGRVPELGGADALAFVTENLDESAIRALIKWPDDGAIDPLVNLLCSKKLDERLNRMVAVGLIRLSKATLPGGKQISLLKRILPAVKDAATAKEIAARIHELTRVNIARGMKVTASRPSQNDPRLAVDGKIDSLSYWQAVDPGSWLSVDLGSVQDISEVKVVTFFKGSRYYQYYVEVSADNKNWKRVADMTQNTKFATAKGFTHTFASTPARYVKVVMLKDSANPGLHIVEIEVYPAK